MRTWKPKTKAPRKSNSASFCHAESMDNTEKTMFHVFLGVEIRGGLMLLVGDV